MPDKLTVRLRLMHRFADLDRAFWAMTIAIIVSPVASVVGAVLVALMFIVAVWCFWLCRQIEKDLNALDGEEGF